MDKMARSKSSSHHLSTSQTDNNGAPSPPPAAARDFPRATRDWRPAAHDSPLYGKHHNGPPTDAVTATNKNQQQLSRHQQKSPVPPLFLSLGDENVVVQPPRTPQGRAIHATFREEGGLSAAERVRMELSTHSTSRAAAGSRANSSEDVFASSSPTYNEEKNGPRSCPTTFNGDATRRTRFSPKRRRSGDLVVSKLLPTRDSVNSLLTYLHELQVSEASLRKQLMSTKQHTEEELYQSLSKLSELQRTMQEVERDRQLGQQRLEEKERCIRELTAKLEQADAMRTRNTSGVESVYSDNGLPPIAEEVHAQTAPLKAVTDQDAYLQELKVPDPPSEKVPALTLEALQLSEQDTPTPQLHPSRLQSIKDQSMQFELASPRSPNRPLWDPWASGGATPMKNLPPVFTMGSTGLDPVIVSSSTIDQTSVVSSNSTNTEDYELKSVLMSPRRAQEQNEVSENYSTAHSIEQDVNTIPPTVQPQQNLPDSQHPSSAFNSDAVTAIPSHPQQEGLLRVSRDAEYTTQDMSFTGGPFVNPVLCAARLPPIEESPYEHQAEGASPSNGHAATANAAEWNDFQGQQEAHTPAAAYEPQVANDNVTNEAIVPPHSTTNAEVPGVLPRPQTFIESAPPQDVAPRQNEDALNSQPEQVPNPEISNGSTNAGSAPPLGTSAPPLAPPPTSEVKPPCPAPSTEKDAQPTSAEPVSLETLLMDFFTEVDKKRLKMAKVYGKRYAGREKWLFAELTKRYGAAKVSTLKTRFESDSNGGVASTSTTSNNNGDAAAEAAVDSHTTKVQATSDHPKAGRQGHPRHPQFFHPPAPASSVDLSAGGVSAVPPPLTVPEPADVSDSQTEVTGESGKVSPGRAARVSPRQRRSGGNIPPHAGPPPSFPPPHEATEGSSVAPTAVRTDGPPSMTGPAPPIQREEPMSQFNQPPPPPPGRMEGNNAAPLGLRQRHNAPEPDAASRKNAGAETPVVSLEGLLKDLYKKHQPDKLKNVAIVAKQYAGKERELVGLLKGKYGALSVKQLEENLEVLERAHRARTGGKGNGKRRGCFVRTISLMFWLSVVLYFSFGAAFVSLVALDAWECRVVNSDEQELESSEECVPLKRELEAFTYERVCDYASQSHPDACFCSEWKARESALFTNLSGADLVNLARLVPFSPDSFGDAWMATVKEQVPSQEFYDSYAKAVVDVSLDVGSFVWSSVLDLAGFNDVSGEESLVASEVEKSDTFDSALLDEESDSDVLTGSQERAAEEEEIEGNLSDANVDEVQRENAGVDSSTVAADAPEPEQTLMEEESEKASSEVEVNDLGVAVNDNTLGDDGFVPAGEESITSAAEESTDDSFEVGIEEHAVLVESTEDIVAAEEPESIVTFEDEPNSAVETEAEGKEEVMLEDAFVDAEMEHGESVRDENDGSLSSSKTDDSEEVNASEEESTGVSDKVLESVKENATEVVASSTDEKRGVDSEEEEEVVEVEVRQNGLDLSYPEKETEVGADIMEETQASAAAEIPANVLFSILDENSRPTLNGDDEVSVLSSETESIDSEVEASDDAAIDALDEKSESEVDSVEEDVFTFIETDIETVESEPYVSVLTEGSEEERIDESSVGLAGEEVETSLVENASSEDSESVDEFVYEGHERETSVATDLEIKLLESDPVVEMAATFLSKEREVEVDKIESNASIDVQAEKEVQFEEEVPEEEGFDVHEIEASTTEAVETELIFTSNEADSVGNLPEESVKEDEAVTDEDETNSVEEEELSNDAEVERSLSDEVDVHSDEEGIEEEAVNDEDDSVVLAEIEANGAELEMEEEDLASVLGEQSLEPTQDIKIEAQEPEESEEEAGAAPVDGEATEETYDEADAQMDELEAPLNIEVENSEESVEEETEVGDGEADATTRSEVEAEQPESEDGVVSELTVESVATEVTEVSNEVGYLVVDSSELNEDVEDVESTDAPSTDGGDEVAAAADEEAVVAADEGTDGNEVEALSDAAVETPLDAVVSDELTAEETEAVPVADDEPAPVVEEEEEEAVAGADEVLVNTDVADAEESSNSDEPDVIENETTDAQQVMEEAPSSEVENGGLVSGVYESESHEQEVDVTTTNVDTLRIADVRIDGQRSSKRERVNPLKVSDESKPVKEEASDKTTFEPSTSEKEEEEEIAFMEKFGDPDEVLRMAELAAAELS